MSDDMPDKVRAVFAHPEDVTLPPNVTPISRARKLSDRSRGLLSKITPASNARAHLQRNYLIKGWLEQNATSILFGPSNAGKSFLALHWADLISKGKPFAGCRVQEAGVLYVAAEGGHGIENRIAALDEPEFWFLPAPLDFGQGSKDADHLCDSIETLTEQHGRAFGLIIIDTLAKTFGAGDESSSRDMGLYLRSIDRIRRRTGAHVMLIHHTGKSALAGARGSSALTAGVDTSIELSEADGGVIQVETRKQRDGRRGGVFAYRLREVILGEDQDGDAVTTCVVEACDPAPQPAQSGGLSGQPAKALVALREAILAEGLPLHIGAAQGRRGVAESVWRRFCDNYGLSGSGDPEARRKAFQRVKRALSDAGEIAVQDGFVWSVSDES